MRTPNLRSFQFVGAIAFLALCAPLVADNAPEVPVGDGGLGSCRADFTVRDEAGNPLYNAKINIPLRYGFLTKRTPELEVGTDTDAKALATGLPHYASKPLNS